MSLFLSRRTCAVPPLLAAAVLLAPLARGQQPPQIWVQAVADFRSGSDGWLPGFTDYDFSQGGMDRLAELRSLPADPELEPEKPAYFVQSANNSDDLFMFLKKPLTVNDGVVAGAAYRVEFLVEFASKEPDGCAGVGGAPGEGVYLKVGASDREPVPILGDEGLRLNVDKGNQSEDGADATNAGNIANGLPCGSEEEKRWVLLERRQAHQNLVTAADNGELWVFVGTDSGYEGLTQLYFSNITVLLTLQEGGSE